MATNVSKRMHSIRQILFIALLKTLANKHKRKANSIYRQYKAVTPEGTVLQVVVKRPNKEPLTATFGGFSTVRIPEGMGVTDFRPNLAWHKHANKRSEVVQRLLAGECELCGKRTGCGSPHP